MTVIVVLSDLLLTMAYMLGVCSLLSGEMSSCAAVSMAFQSNVGLILVQLYGKITCVVFHPN